MHQYEAFPDAGLVTPPYPQGAQWTETDAEKQPLEIERKRKCEGKRDELGVHENLIAVVTRHVFFSWPMQIVSL